MTKKIWSIIIVLFVVVIIAAIWKMKERDTNTIIIGAILPLTGDAAQWGIPPRNGAQLAVDEINMKGGVLGKRLALAIEDSRCDPKEGVSSFNKLRDTQNVNIILGEICSSVTLAVAPLAERNKTLLISPASTSPKITTAGDFVFRVIPSDDLRGKVFAEYIFNDVKIHRVAILYINNEGGVGNKDAFEERFVQLGGIIETEEAYTQTATDLRSQITKIRSSNVEAVIVVSYPKDTVLVMKQVRELDLSKPLFFQTEAVEDPNVLREAGPSAEGSTYILPAPAEGNITDTFASLYEQKYGIKPELFAVEAYDIIHLIASAIEHNPKKQVSSEQIRDYLYEVEGYKGASGTITFDNNGDVVKPMAIKIIEDSKSRLLKVR